MVNSSLSGRDIEEANKAVMSPFPLDTDLAPYWYSASSDSEEVGSGHAIAQAVYIVPIGKGLLLFQGDERKEDCILLRSVSG